MTDTTVQDELWTHFEPLLAGLAVPLDGRVLVAGGYGLFLKQNWLLSRPDTRILVPLERWLDTTPRVTKDLDLIVGLDLIADAPAHSAILAELTRNEFRVSEKNPRWQFVKELPDARRMLVELHTPRPPEDAPKLAVDKIRVKYKPSLGQAGVHGRLNPEAAGCELHPMRIEVQNQPILLPNPLTWSMMKLTAAQDRWEQSQNAASDLKRRDFSRAQAIKHAQDACRVVAMTTLEENDHQEAVRESIQNMPVFGKAARIVSDSFSHDNQWAAQVLSDKWQPDDLVLIFQMLTRWFGV